MNTQKSIAVVGVATLASTGAFLFPAMASSHVTTHTLRFTAVQGKMASFSKSSGGQQEKDLNSKGKIIGFDEIYFHFNQKTNHASGGVTLETSGGFLYGTLNFNNNGPVTHGKVTGGTGRYKDVTGTIVGKSLNKKGTRTAVTITYHR